MNSKQKGKRGERGFAALLCCNGFIARRGQQFRGSPESPDIICKELPFHFEVKFGATHSLASAFRQAAEECGEATPIVASKRNRAEWMVYLRAQDFLDLVANWKDLERND